MTELKLSDLSGGMPVGKDYIEKNNLRDVNNKDFFSWMFYYATFKIDYLVGNYNFQFSFEKKYLGWREYHASPSKIEDIYDCSFLENQGLVEIRVTESY